MKHIDTADYDVVVSLGNKCTTTTVLRKLGIYKESFPFDAITSTPHLILKYLQNQEDFLPKAPATPSPDGLVFFHFDLNEPTTREAFQRRFNRLFDALANQKRILFCYTSQADVWNELNSRHTDNYVALVNIQEYLKHIYPISSFKMLCIHTNKEYPDTGHIVNYTLNFPIQYMTNTAATMTPDICKLYNDAVEALMRKIFRPMGILNRH